LALSLIAGAVASTFLSWPTIPVLYYMVHSRHQAGPEPINLKPNKEILYDSRTRCAPDGRRHGAVVACACAFFSLYWLWLTVFVGLNLLQSAFTNWCPAMSILRAVGLKDAGCGIPSENES
jgi:hypothetical protein